MSAALAISWQEWAQHDVLGSLDRLSAARAALLRHPRRGSPDAASTVLALRHRFTSWRTRYGTADIAPGEL
jgi:hypothetical protein